MVGMRVPGPLPGERAIADQLIDRVLIEILGGREAASVYARLLSGFDSPVAPRLVAELLGARLAAAIGRATQGGWTPADLAQLVRRRADERHTPMLVCLVRDELDRHPRDRIHPGWFDELGDLGPSFPSDLHNVRGLEHGLALGAALTMLPTIATVLPPPGRVLPAVPQSVDASDAQRLAKVRALLAKAESTDFPGEAEALSGKAQELISRYALERLVTGTGDPASAPDIRARRLWIDAPYVLAKAMLVDAVGKANRCRSAVSEGFGFVTVVGDPGDLEAVELMVTSLLVQSTAAMLGHVDRGRRDASSRTASFRRAFLIAYASRIGERLATATDEAASTSARRDALVPALRRRTEEVDAAFDFTFPRLRERRTTYSNGAGWAAGRAAADRARLDPRQRLTRAAADPRSG